MVLNRKDMVAGSAWAFGGLALGVISTLLVLLAFSTPYWIESDANAIHITQMEKLGLWEACFNGYSDYRDGFGKVFNGCWWMFSREYDHIRERLMPGWFRLTQGLMTIDVVLALAGSFLGLLVILGCFPSKAQKPVVAGISLSYYLIAILTAIACVTFGIRAETDRTWLKQPTRRHLSWSFYCAVCGGIIAVLVGCIYSVYFIVIRRTLHHSTAYRAHEMRHIRSERQRQQDRYWR